MSKSENKYRRNSKGEWEERQPRGNRYAEKGERSNRQGRGRAGHDEKPAYRTKPERRGTGSFDGYGEHEDFGSENANIIIGRNPVMEALKAEREIDKLVVAKGAEGSIVKIIGMAKDRGIPVMYSEKVGLDRISSGKAHQGVAAYMPAHEYVEVEDILRLAKERGEDPFIIVLDNIEDPHNLGAIMRTAETAGAHGIIIPKRRAVGLTETVAKASAGAIEYMPVAKVVNIAQTLEALKERGIWVAACDMGDSMYYDANLTGPMALVVGAEGEGISRLVKEKCDYVVSIPMLGHISSLNASNAAAILIYEICKQRLQAKGKENG